MLVAMTRLSGVRAWIRFTRSIEPRQRDDRLDAVLAQRPFELVLGVDRVERRDDRAELPGAELGDEELRAVGQEQRDAVAARTPSAANAAAHASLRRSSSP